jgi:murein DD-endopeptidase MepM/ murein hydrolase activator NlpD
VSRSDLITLDPGGTRIFVRFKDANGITRGATSVAVRSTLFVPLFQQPFTGEFAVSNFFDHNVPQEFVDANGNMVTFWGEIVPFFDGHQGYDFPMPEGTPLLAVADGTVSFAGQSADFFCPPLNRTVNGPLIEIDHVTTEGTFKSLYFHLSRADVTIGQRVQTGQQIGLSGNTGCSTRPHLHFETRRVVNGRAIVIDPYGWDGSGIDPWTLHPQGTESVRLWSSGQALALFKETRLAPNPSGSSAPVTLTVFRWMGVRDSQYPNNEFVEVTLDPRFAPTGSADLTGFSLRNNNGDTFNFPSGLILRSDQPIRVFTGAGTNTSTTLFWGRSSGVWNNVSDCVRLVSPTGGQYRLANASGACS